MAALPNKAIVRKMIFISALFAFGGVVLILSALIDVVKMQKFLASASLGTGTIITYHTHIEHNKNGDRIMYTPVVGFTTADGIKTSFTDKRSTSYKLLSEGSLVQILYAQNDPGKAMIDSFANKYQTTIILAALGVAFGVFGFYSVVRWRDKLEIEDWLIQVGEKVQAKVTGVEKGRTRGRPALSFSSGLQTGAFNTEGLNMNRGLYWVVVAQWIDTKANKVYVFESNPINYDPTDLVMGRNITVTIMPEDPSYYMMDLSFLPPSGSNNPDPMRIEL